MKTVFEIYSITPFLFGGAVPAAIKKIEKLGGPYMAVEFFNDVAYNLCDEYQVQLHESFAKRREQGFRPGRIWELQ